MKKHALITCLLALTAPLQAALLDDFETTNIAATATQLGAAPGPMVITNAADSNQFLRLVYDGVGSQNNHYSYDVSDTGAWERITAAFDFRIASAGAAADGLSILFMPIATYGASGDGPAYTAEEPNVAGCLALGIDAHPATGANRVNDFGLHWNGVELVNQTVGESQVDIDNGIFNRAILELERTGNSFMARAFIITNSLGSPGAKTLLLESVVPGMLPFENRVQFAGRTGGLDMDVDLDNISITYSNLYTNAVASISTNRLYQDFDLLGGTPYTSRQLLTTGLGGTRTAPGPILVDDGDGHGVFMRLVQDEVANRNSITLDLDSMDVASSHRYLFDFRASSIGFAADGWSLALLPEPVFGTTGTGPDLGTFEEPNRADVLAFGFDLHEEENGVNDVSVHWDGSEYANVTLDPNSEIDLNNAVWNRAEATIEYVSGGAIANLYLHPDIDGVPSNTVHAIQNVFLPGVPQVQYRLQFGARTAGRFHQLDIDNIRMARGPQFFPIAGTVQDFDQAGTGYEAWRNEDSANQTIELFDDGDASRHFLRLLTRNIQNHRSSLNFDLSAAGTGVVTGQTTAGQIAFRARGGDTNNPADGFGFMLIPSGTYGTHGPGAYYNGALIQAEKPNYPGVFAVGVDFHSEAQNVNDVSVHWNNAQLEVARLPLSFADLDTNEFHRLEFTLDWTSTGAWANVYFTPDAQGIPGTRSNIIRRLVADLMPYDFRVEVAGRTGGATVDLDIDQLAVRSSTPEDSEPDGLPDAWELQHFTNLVASAGLPEQDFDGDGLNDRAELLAGSDPADPGSTLSLRAAPDLAGQQLEWDSSPGRRYRIWRKDNLLNTPWSLYEYGIDATAPLNTLLDPSPGFRWLYRLELEPTLP